MPGLMIRLIMNALKKSKPNNIHYVLRDYEAVRNQGMENSTKLPLPKNTVKEKTPYGYWYCKPGASRKKVLFYIHGGGFNSGGAEYSINMTRNFCKSDKAFRIGVPPLKKYFLYSTNEKMFLPFPNGVAVWVERNTVRKKSFCLQKFGATAFFGLLAPTEFAGFGKLGSGYVARPRQTVFRKLFSYLYSK